jgi:peptidoglycan-associated lipoprotein
MAFRFLSLFAAVLFLAACETPSDQTGTASGTGGAGKSSSVDRGPASTGTATTSTAAPKRSLSTILTVDVGDRVFFDFDKYSLKAKARQTLERQATFLKNNLGIKVILQGHADERGTREYNLALGERRANSAKDYLVALGINPNRITIISFGKERPAVAGSNEAAWSQNRRAVTAISEGAGS